MKQFFYAVSYLKNTWGNNLIKIFTLTLGLAIGLILFARISFDLSYDKFLPGAENIYQVQTVYTTGVGTEESNTMDYSNTFQPVAPTMPFEIPGVVAGTSILESGETVVFEGVDRYTVKTIYADTMFFKALPFKVLSGNPQELKVDRNVMLSKSLAETIFKGEDPVGKTLFDDKAHKVILTVIGTFEDVPENSHMDFNLIYSIAGRSRNSWNGGDGYAGYVRLQPGTNVDKLNREDIPAMLARHMDRESMKKGGYSFDCYLKPLVNLHTDNKETKQTLVVLSVLATLILLSVSLNYVMISISSLATRARTMAIYKSNGATSGNIFSMAMIETLVLVLIALICTALLILLFQGQVASLTGVSLSALFSGKQLLIGAGLVLFVILLSGVIPARIFAAIPVTQAFRFYNYSKRGWKQGLLCVQVICAVFMVTFLSIILLQYHQVLDKDMGYESDNLVFCKLDSVPYARRQVLRAELLRSPEVKEIAFSVSLACEFFSGTPLMDEDLREICTVRFDYVDTSYVNTLGLKLMMGQNLPHETGDPHPILVNRRLVEKMHWKDDPVGKKIHVSKNLQNAGVIVGVVDNFVVGSLFTEQTPVMLYGIPEEWRSLFLTVRLQEMSPSSRSSLENRLRELLPDEDIVLISYRDYLHESYRDTERFRGSVAIAAIFMLLITLMGLIGYVSDEIRRRSKEIAIRKVNGATATDVFRLLLRNIAWLSIPSAVIGLLGSYMAASKWLEQFAEKITLNPFIFITSGIVLLCVIFICVVLRSWHAANENPVKSIKLE